MDSNSARNKNAVLKLTFSPADKIEKPSPLSYI